jgi:heptosyltransferase-2
MAGILIIRLSSIGDILLTTPVIRCLKRALPDAQIAYLTKKAYAPLVKHHPLIDDVIELNSGGLKELISLRNTVLSKYDVVMDLHRNIRSCLLTLGLRKQKIFKYRKFTLKRHVLVYLKINLLKNAPSVPERYLECVLQLGVQDDGKGLDFYSDKKTRTRAREILKKGGLNMQEAIALAPGARWVTKRWPAQKFSSLIKLLPKQKFIILGDNQDKAVAREIVSAANDSVLNLAGKTSLDVTAEILRQCRALVSNDTGLMHLGCAVKIPTVALFGSTVRMFGFFPFRANARVLEREVKCRPCTTIGKNKCKIGTFECLNEIRAEEVAEGLQSLMS